VTGDKVQDIIHVVPKAIAVDMESGAIAQVCHINNVKFVAFRVISDVPGKKDVDNLQQYADFWARLADNSFTVTKTFVDKLKNEWR
jgi:adenosylhomocysteine nucleosidase